MQNGWHSPQWRHLYGWQQSHGKTTAASRIAVVKWHNSHCCGAVIKQKTHTKIQCAKSLFAAMSSILQDHVGAGYACLVTKRLVPLICYFLFMSLGKSATGTGGKNMLVVQTLGLYIKEESCSINIWGRCSLPHTATFASAFFYWPWSLKQPVSNGKLQSLQIFTFFSNKKNILEDLYLNEKWHAKAPKNTNKIEFWFWRVWRW